MEAENITKRLSEKFEKLQKEINRKIKEEKNRVGKILF
jgi:chaperonin cofactor prefoldin